MDKLGEKDPFFNELKVEDVDLIHQALMQCPRLVVHIADINWTDLQAFISSTHLRYVSEIARSPLCL